MEEFAVAALGLIILVLAGDALVRGAVNVSLRLGVPALIVSLTIVALGTSAPEMLVGVKAAYEGVPGIALGNVVGSNTANVLLVLGVPAMLAGLATSQVNPQTAYLQMIIASLLFSAFAATGQITGWMGLVLTAAFIGFMLHAVADARRRWKSSYGQPVLAESGEEVEGADPGMRWRMIILFLVLGMAGLPLGAELLVRSASEIARDYDISETIIGLTLVALGTSLPELATTIAAAFRKQADVAIGNVIGSNLANVLLILGVSSLVAPIPVPAYVLWHDISVMMVTSLLLAPFIFLSLNITRAWGVVFTFGYVAYVVTLFL